MWGMPFEVRPVRALLGDGLSGTVTTVLSTGEDGRERSRVAARVTTSTSFCTGERRFWLDLDVGLAARGSFGDSETVVDPASTARGMRRFSGDPPSMVRKRILSVVMAVSRSKGAAP